MEHWIDILISAFEMVAILFTFDAFFLRRFTGKRFWAVAIISFPVLYFLVHTFNIPVSYSKIAILSVSFLCLNCILYHGKLMLRLLVTILSYALLYLIELFGQFLFLSILGIEYNEYAASGVLYNIGGISVALICVGLAYMLRCLHKPVAAVTRTNWLWGVLALLFPLFSFAVQLPLFYLVATQQLQPMWAATTCIMMIASNVFMFGVVGLLEKNIQMHESALSLSERIRAQAENIEALSTSYANQRKMTHDFRQYLHTLSGMLECGEVENAREYISEMQERQSERALLVNTHNAAMDAILNQKAYAAKQEHIDIHFDVTDLSRLNIKRVDYTVVIANLFDNAIEASKKLEEKERWISVQAIYDEAFEGEPAKLFFSIVNASPPVTILNGSIATTKEDSSLHGFGIPNIKSILARYNAVYVMQYDNGRFQFSIDWPDIVVD